jgi:hypothetical protein
MNKINDRQFANKLRDSLNNTSINKTVKGAMLALNAVQGQSKDTILVGTAFAFSRLCKAYGIKPNEVLQITDNVTKAAEDEGRPEVKGVIDWVEKSKDHRL